MKISPKVQNWTYPAIKKYEGFQAQDMPIGVRSFVAPRLNQDEIDLSQPPEARLSGIKITRKALEGIGTAAYQISVSGISGGATSATLLHTSDFIRSKTSQVARLESNGSLSENPAQGVGEIRDHEIDMSPDGVRESGSQALFSNEEIKIIRGRSMMNVGEYNFFADGFEDMNGHQAPQIARKSLPLGSAEDDTKMTVASRIAAALIATPDMDYEMACSIMDRVGAALQNDTTVARLGPSSLADFTPDEKLFIKYREASGQVESEDGPVSDDQAEAVREDIQTYLAIARNVPGAPTLPTIQKKAKKTDYSTKPIDIEKVRAKNSKLASKYFSETNGSVSSLGGIPVQKNFAVSEELSKATDQLLEVEGSFEEETWSWLDSIEVFGKPEGKKFPSRGKKLMESLFTFGLDLYPEKSQFAYEDDQDRPELLTRMKEQKTRVDQAGLQEWLRETLPNSEQAEEVGVDGQKRAKALDAWLEAVSPSIFDGSKKVSIYTLQDKGNENFSDNTHVIMGDNAAVVVNIGWQV